ncbi:Uncharacterised protein [Achromobacter sp. 2789STDY5608615]|nr:Uncharacterised protein [Achromobacter sp. 2789STDY5608621]CUK16629.1 Uncharacterised protein [Achromobacter sp. 2789STDY5608615]
MSGGFVTLWRECAAGGPMSHSSGRTRRRPCHQAGKASRMIATVQSTKVLTAAVARACG